MIFLFFIESSRVKVLIARLFGSEPVSHHTIGTYKFLTKSGSFIVIERGEASDFPKITAAAHRFKHREQEEHRFLTKSSPVLVYGTVIGASVNIACLVSVTAVIFRLVIMRNRDDLYCKGIFLIIPFVHYLLFFSL